MTAGELEADWVGPDELQSRPVDQFCGPHCGTADGHTKHCPACHRGDCEAAQR